MKIWQRMIFLDILKFILFFLICSYLIYFTIDFSIHGNRIFSKDSITLFQIFLFYYHNFIIYLNLFSCLALIFSIIKVYYSMNTQNELIALQMSGISKIKLSTPLFMIAAFLSISFYINYEFMTPISTNAIENFKNENLRSNKKKEDIHTILLDNGTKVIYHKYDKELIDVYWVISADDIWHMKTLNPNTVPPQGTYVDHFTREKKNNLIKSESFSSYAFFKITFDKNANMAMQPFENRPISMLYDQFDHHRFSSAKERAQILTQLNYKIAFPLLPFLIVFALIPICTKFSRMNYFFLIIFISLISFIGFFVFLDAITILSENNLGSPFWLIWSPFLILFSFLGWRFIKVSLSL